MVNEIKRWGRCWVVVTGASRGLGASICKMLSSKLDLGSVIVGVARSPKGLSETMHSVLSESVGVKFMPIVLDLSSDPSAKTTALFNDTTSHGTQKFDRIILMHNAGTLGPVQYMKDITKFDEIHNYFSTNLSSTIALNNILLKYAEEFYKESKLHVINISSLCASVPFKSWAMYCSGKAARDMIFKCLSAEQTNIDVISYAPGPLNNDMQVQARTTTADLELRQVFQDMVNQGKLLEPDVSAAKLISILESGKYESGAHVDYYDA